MDDGSAAAGAKQGAAVVAAAANKTSDVIAQIGQMTPAEQEQLNELGDAVEERANVKLSERTTRALGTIIAAAVFAIVAGLVVLVGIVTVTRPDQAKDVTSFAQVPISIGLTGLIGIAGALGLQKRNE